jgi:hypothetical protein
MIGCDNSDASVNKKISIVTPGHESRSGGIIFTGPDLIRVIGECFDAFPSMPVPDFDRFIGRAVTLRKEVRN